MDASEIELASALEKVSKNSVKILDRKPRISQSNLGRSYLRINNELVKLKEELNTDLVMIDAFMWYLANYHSDKKK